MNAEPTLDALERLADLREKGILTEEEYLAKKAEILAQPGRAMMPVSSPLSAGPTAEQQRVNNAFLIEVVGGILGFMGLGYMYAGRTNDGLVRLIAWWIVLAVMWTSVAVLTTILIGVCLWAPAAVVQVGGPIWSANRLKLEMEQNQVP